MNKHTALINVKPKRHYRRQLTNLDYGKFLANLSNRDFAESEVNMSITIYTPLKSASIDNFLCIFSMTYQH